MIEFLCPNGHRIHCPEEQAGRAAKCPRCGVKFRIPQQSEVQPIPAGEGGSDVGRVELTDSGIAPPPVAEQPQKLPQKESIIEFLCPNGHRLHGPASLQGRPGECPECGSLFRIPRYEEVAQGEAPEQQLGVGRADGASGSALNLSQDRPAPKPSLKGTVDDRGDTAKIPRSAVPGAAPPAGPKPRLCQLVAALWAERSKGATLELRLTNGETLVPDHFAGNLSNDSHGVFAVKDANGKYTLTAVAWDLVEQILVRGVEEPPQ